MSQSDFDVEAFNELPELQRSLLQLISIIYAPVAATPLASCAHRVGINNPRDGENFTLHSLRPVLVDLIHKGFLEGTQGKYNCPVDICEEILLTSISDNTFNEYSTQVLAAFSATESFGRVLWQSVEHGVSHARIFLFQGLVDKLANALELLHERYQYRESILSKPGFFPATFGSPVNQVLLDTLTDEMFSLVFLELVDFSLENMHDQTELWKLLTDRQEKIPDFQNFQHLLIEPQARYSLLSGNTDLFPELPAGTHTQTNMLKDEVTYDDRHFHWHIANSAKQLSQGN
ncbi:MAG: hypothetical protein KAG86_09585, partial [Gammaproteobacteria bacterium]|nr:hypothetical protein [Gammaproteobacteria bacterium]